MRAVVHLSALSVAMAFALAFALACSGPATDDPVPPPDDATPTADDATPEAGKSAAPMTDTGAAGVRTPATFTATLPCADCPGIEWTLTLLEDGTYRLREVYLQGADGEDQSFVQLGTWDTGGPNHQILLHRQDEGPMHLAVESADTLRLLDQQGQPIESQFDYALRRGAEVDRIADVFPMRGEYTYMADAARFTECRTGISLPVTQEGDNAALERAYLGAREEPGGPLLVTFDGSFAMRPPMDRSGLEEVVLVDAFGEVLPGQHCDDAAAATDTEATLTGTRWQLTELPGEEAYTVDPGLEAHLVLDAEASRVSGSSGCNRLTGAYTLDGDALALGPLAGTRMACPQPAMELESRFHAALEAVAGYSIEGEALTLTGPQGPVARFERSPE